MPNYRFITPCGASDVTITFPSTSGTLQLAGGGGITGFTSQISTAAPNATVNVSQLLVDVSTTNGDAALEPKGTGAILAQIPTSTTAGGDKRGTYAVDWQRVRSTNSARVASGSYAVISGGNNNRASNNYDVVAGGLSNQASGSGCFIGGGTSNTASGSASTVGGGNQNSATQQYSGIFTGNQNQALGFHAFVGSGNTNISQGQYGVVVGGDSNSVNNQYSFIGAGRSNVINGEYSVVTGGNSSRIDSGSNYSAISGGLNNRIGELSASIGSFIGGGGTNKIRQGNYNVVTGGASNINDGAYSVIVGGNGNQILASKQFSVAKGQGAVARDSGQFAFASYYYSSVGDVQGSDYVFHVRTGNATPTAMQNAGTTGGVTIPLGTTAVYHIMVSARQPSSSNVGGWILTGLIENTSGTVTLFNPTTNLIHKSVGSWDVSATANNTNDTLDVTVTGGPGIVAVQWTAVIRISFCTYA